ncbi:unnamed protein product [Ambrosiozyma monospora]|uniref:Unnamed protein product n=1 Tax=Ambrosiozyma monospora TaxID=43982 RepID=A0A9W6Z0S3_AMBMO|nr:unnamed protein product [Ambrosiozyma monospora]
MHTKNNTIYILYGSETGQSQNYANELSYILRYHHHQTIVSTLDDFNLRSIIDIKYLIVVCSTASQGELPRNATQKFWKFMVKKKLPSILLNNLQFTTLGLGDSSYSQFNFAIRKIHARLLQLGGKELCGRAELDELFAGRGKESAFRIWCDEVVSSLDKHIGINEAPIDNEVLLEPEWIVQIDRNSDEVVTKEHELEVAVTRYTKTPNNSQKNQTVPTDQKQNQTHHLLQITENQRLTSKEHFQDVRRLVLKNVSNSPLLPLQNYEPGDMLEIIPFNDPHDIEMLLKWQPEWYKVADLPLKIILNPKLNRKTVLDSTIQTPNSLISTPVEPLTLRSLLTHHIDLTHPPTRLFFNKLYHFSKDEREREKLKEFAGLSPHNYSINSKGFKERNYDADDELLFEYAIKPHRSVLEVLLEFDSIKIPVEFVLELFVGLGLMLN